MAPRVPKTKSEEPSGYLGDSAALNNGLRAEEADEELDSDSAMEDGLVPAEEEYHTEDSNDSEDDQNEDQALSIPSASLLPAHLLKPAADPTDSDEQALVAADIPYDRLTAKQKKAQRNRSRQAKKRVYDRLREETKGSGVIEAGKAAQVKRGVFLHAREKVRSGRVGKPTSKRQVSGRQQLLEQRKRTAGKGGMVSGPGKKVKSGSKR